MPRQKPHRSVQEVSTPRNFIDAVEARFGQLHVDLAASTENAKAPRFIGEEEDSLASEWRRFGGRRMWLNPPFGEIAPWSAKCAATSRLLKPSGRIFLLVPASTGANWFAEHVWRRARVLFLQGRLTFEGHDAPYPKDLVLAVYGARPGAEIWDWRREAEREMKVGA